MYTILVEAMHFYFTAVRFYFDRIKKNYVLFIMERLYRSKTFRVFHSLFGSTSIDRQEDAQNSE